MQTRFMTWAQGFFVAGLALGLLFIIPSAWFPLQLGKLLLVSACLFVAAVLFVLGGGMRILMRERNPLFVFLAGLLPLSYLLSYRFSTDPAIGFKGYAIETDTVLFTVICFLTFTLALGLLRTIRSARAMKLGAVIAAIAVGAFQYVAILFGTSILPQVFSDRSVNLVGKWNDLGVVVGLVFVLTLYAIEHAGLSLRRQIIAGVVAAVSLLLLAIVNFPFIWWLVLPFCLILALWSFLEKRGRQWDITMVPWVPLAGAVLSVALLFWGSVVNTNLTSVFPVTSLEVRPSAGSTLDILKAAHGDSVQRFMVGTGPQTFGESWLKYKPTSVNQTPFWNLDFNVGFSTFMTALSTVGIIGALAWAVPLLLVLLGTIAALRSSILAGRERFYTFSFALSALYLWASILFYVPSQIVILLTFALSGGFCALVLSRRDAAAHTPGKLMRMTTVLAGVVFIVLVAWTTESVGRRYFSEMYTNQGFVALGQGKVDEALALAARAQKTEETTNALRLGTDAGFAKLQQIAQSGQNPTQQQIADFANQAQKTIPQGQAAIAKNPHDYRAYLSLGRVYDLLSALNVQGAYENAKQRYEEAMQYNPTNPQIPLLVARLEASRGNLPGVEQQLAKSLTLKADYTDAILYVVQLNVAKKDIPNAIRAAQAAVRTAPGVASIWFQLGLLYYSANDSANAIPVLEQAVKIQSDYANAKYFLGLSYAAQNRTQDAIQQFMDLEKTNPENQEVKLILSNLQAGKAPFSGAQPPVTSTPQNRTTAPISQ